MEMILFPATAPTAEGYFGNGMEGNICLDGNAHIL